MPVAKIGGGYIIAIMAALHMLASDIDEYVELYKKELVYDLSPALTSWEKEVIYRCVESCGFELKNENDFVATSTEEKEYNLVLIVHGSFTIESVAIFHTSSGQFHIKSLIFHESYSKKRYEHIAKQLVKNESVIMSSGSDEEYLCEMLRDAEEMVRWEKAKQYAPGASVWDVCFDEQGHFVRKELDVVSL